MSAASWVLIVWLVAQLFARSYRVSKEKLSTGQAVATGLGVASWFAGMVFLISLSGGWQ